MKPLPKHARAVIIGGGVAGASAVYPLAKLGWQDVVGLIGQLRATANMTHLAKYSAELYQNLEAETGVATGLRQIDSITVVLSESRKEEIYRQTSMARAFGVPAEQISTTEAKVRYPHLNTTDVLGAVYLPMDGQGDPANIALAMAKGVRQMGVRIIENIKVQDSATTQGRVASVITDQGEITCDRIINCAGMGGREVGAMVGVTVPLHACEHFYIVTEGIDGFGKPPVLRVSGECAYYKEEAGKTLLGAFEPKSKPWGMNGIPEEFEFDQLLEDFDHFEPILENAINLMPLLAGAGIHTFFNGPESFTPDDRYYLGEAPEAGNYWVCAGVNSVGIQSAGGAGMALAQWMEDGQPPFDLWDVDIRRAQPFQRNRRYLRERVTETLGLLYADHYPYQQPETARGVRRSPVHHMLQERGAIFGEMAGWERANWFANEGQERAYRYSWGHQNWFENQRSEHMAVRESVGVFDMTSFGKIRIEGRDALAFLQKVCMGQTDVDTGKIVYTQILNPRGGIECGLTVTRLSETAFLLIVPGGKLQRDLAWLQRHFDDTFAVMGPDSRALLQMISPDVFGNAAHPFGTMRRIEIGMGLASAHRVTYVGELGWGIYASADQAVHIFGEILGAGSKPCGLHVLDSCRLEKAYRHFGHDITDEDHIREADLGFAVKPNKGDFIGRDVVLAKQDAGLSRRLVQFKLTDPEPMRYHNEPILRDGKIAGYLSSGGYGHALGASVGLGYVPCEGQSLADLLASDYEIEIASTRHAAIASLKPLYDPAAKQVKM